MISLYDELSEKMARQAQVKRRWAAKVDIGMLLVANGDALRDLWVCADEYERTQDSEGLSRLRGSVEKLRPLFGERFAQ